MKKKNFFKLNFFVLVAFFLTLLIVGLISFSKKIQLAEVPDSSSSSSTIPPTSQPVVDCHLTRHDAAYGNLWSNVFKNTFPWLKGAKVTKIWVVTDLSVRPFLYQQFDVSLFEYHGVEKYQKWSDIPNQEKCKWFNHYPNDPGKNPWLSSGFFSLRGLMFYFNKINQYRSYYQTWQVTNLWHDNLNIDYFLQLSNDEILQSLAKEKILIDANGNAIDASKIFLFYLGEYFYNQPNKKTSEGFILGSYWLKKLHRDKKKLINSSYDWLKFDWRMWDILDNNLRKNFQFLYLYHQTRSLFWELDHYQIREINGIDFTNLAKISKTAINYYDFSSDVTEEFFSLIKNLSSSSIAQFRQPLENLLQAKKEEIFWKIIKDFLPQLKKYDIMKFKNLDLVSLFLEPVEGNFASLQPASQAVIKQLITKFSASFTVSQPLVKVAKLATFYQGDNYQEVGQLARELNQLILQVVKVNASACPGLNNLNYQKWWETIFRPLVPKLKEYQVEKIFYGIKNVVKQPGWRANDYYFKSELFFFPKNYNYYGVDKYSTYQQLPDQIKCAIPSFLFDGKRIKTLKTLKILTEIIFPRKTQYQTYPPYLWKNGPKVWHFPSPSSFDAPFDITAFFDQTEADIFTLIEKSFELDGPLRNLLVHLGFHSNRKRELDYMKEVDDYFTWSQFWLDSKPFWKQIVEDQFLIAWRGANLTSLKENLTTDFYRDLSSTSQKSLRNLKKNSTFSLILLVKIKTLTDQLLQLDKLWKDLQALRTDLVQYQITSLEGIEFANLEKALTLASPLQLTGLAKAELVSLLEIKNFTTKLANLVALAKPKAKADKLSSRNILLIILLPLIFLIILVGGYSYHKKKKQKKTQPS